MNDDLVSGHIDWLRSDHEYCNPILADRIEQLAEKLAKAEQMLEREIRRVRKIQLDLPPPHTVTLSSVQSEYELMLKELKGETK